MQVATMETSQKTVLAAALAGLAAVAVAAFPYGGMQKVYAVLIGGLAGLALYHASFGFTAAWRHILTEKKGTGLRAQFVLILLTSAVSFPLIAWGADFGVPTGGFVFPFGVAAAIGAFMFGIGMQLGGGCASGTLFTSGGGSTRMMVTLLFFVIGSVLGAAHFSQWNQLPKLPAYSLVKDFGPHWAFLLTALVLGAIALWTIRVEKTAHGELLPSRQTGSLLKGPWSPVLGAVMIAVVCILTFVLIGRPWGITSGFVVWGKKGLELLGFGGQVSVLRDTTSVMNFGIILGAMAAAALAGKFAPVWHLSAKDLATAVIGGLLMGYGARLAYGCNIGAYLGGITSGSLHGWLWLVFAFVGSLLGTRLRFKLGMG